MDVLKRVPVREQDPKVRATNFEEVCLGYNQEEAQEEATRCLNCKNAQCVKGCPVSINIPKFISEVKEGKFKDAARDHQWYQGSCDRFRSFRSDLCRRSCKTGLRSNHFRGTS